MRGTVAFGQVDFDGEERAGGGGRRKERKKKGKEKGKLLEQTLLFIHRRNFSEWWGYMLLFLFPL